MSPKATKEHILLSTIEAIEKHGLMNLTTRLIAEEAGVNNAALHYYYGTKEQLVDAALNQTTNHMLGDIKAILESSGPLEQRIRKMFEYIINGTQQFPNIIRAHMLGPLLYSQRQNELSLLLESWINMTVDAVEPHVSSAHSKQLKLILNMVFSMIMISGLLAVSPEAFGWINLDHPDERNALIDYALNQILKD